MPIYLYCVLPTRSEAPTGPLAGIDGSPVRAIELAGLELWVSEVDVPAVVPTLERARAHDAVVRTALEGATPVPARFGQIFADDRTLLEGVERRRHSLLAALERVRGAVEMTVTAPLNRVANNPRPTSGSGRAYLESVRREQAAIIERIRQADFLHQRVAAVVSGLVMEEARAEVGAASRTLGISHLVSRSIVPQYRAATAGLGVALPAQRILITGPWAPYSFVSFADD